MGDYLAAGRGFWKRLAAIAIKEVQPLRRDRLSFALMFVLPIMELLLFGYAINTSARHLPTAVIARRYSTAVMKRDVRNVLGQSPGACPDN